VPNAGRSEWMRAQWSDPEFAARQRANLARGRGLRWSKAELERVASTVDAAESIETRRARSGTPMRGQNQVVVGHPSRPRPRPPAQVVGSAAGPVDDHLTTRIQPSIKQSSGPKPWASDQVVRSAVGTIDDRPKTRSRDATVHARAAAATAVGVLGLGLVTALLRRQLDERAHAGGPETGDAKRQRTEPDPLPSWSPPEYRW
jgi:hypothetical protein